MDGGANGAASRAVAMPAATWASFARTLIVSAAVLFALLFGALLVIDPYDTGRIGLLRARGVPEQGPYTANASRGRDPRFNAAIIGNSHVQALKPERLDRLTGLSFVSLIMPGSKPLDQLRVLDWFVSRHETGPRAIVLGADRLWCLEQAGATEHLPGWLYERDARRYVAGLIQYRSLEAAVARLRLLAGASGAARPDGYWDYRPDYRRLGLDDRAVARGRLAARIAAPVNATGRFPAIEGLRVAVASLPQETALVLLRPPLFVTTLPEPGSPEARTEEACRDALAAVAASRPHSVLVDWMKAAPETRDPDNFYDHDHYTDALAGRIEPDVAAALPGREGAAGGLAAAPGPSPGTPPN